MLTQNKSRKEPSPGCERVPNLYGHILELSPESDDHGLSKMKWLPLVLGGPQSQGGTQSDSGWIKNPDNGAFDAQGRLWVTADAKAKPNESFGNGLWICPQEGEQRVVKLNVSAQYPMEQNRVVRVLHQMGGLCLYLFSIRLRDQIGIIPSTRWPDFRSDRPPRPSIVAIEKEDGSVMLAFLLH